MLCVCVCVSAQQKLTPRALFLSCFFAHARGMKTRAPSGSGPDKDPASYRGRWRGEDIGPTSAWLLKRPHLGAEFAEFPTRRMVNYKKP
jgi:hypothetical protein